MLSFLIQLTVAWSAFALLYQTALRRETFFQLNRWYLLSTALLGLLLPFAHDLLPPVTGADGAPLVVLPTVLIGPEKTGRVSFAGVFEWIMWAYWAGVALGAGRMFWGLAQIGRMAMNGRRERLPDHSLLIRSEHACMPFSFFQLIFVPSGFQLSNPEMQAMLAHERAHARDGHTIDVLFAEILCIIFWFLPLTHWYRRSLREVHEYLADAAAAGRTNRRQYGLLLLQQAQTPQTVSFVHHFYQSPLKQRLIMLTKKSSAPVRGLQYGLLLPMLALLLMLFQGTSLSAQNAAPATAPTVYQTCDKMPEFPGGQAALMDFMVKNMRYPPEAANDKAEALIVLEFVVNEDGSISALKPKSNDYRPDFLEESVRLVRNMPKWTPGENKGQKVKCQVTLPIKFKLS